MKELLMKWFRLRSLGSAPINYKREETPDEWKSIGEYPETLRQRMESLYKLSEQLGQSKFELYSRIKMSFRCELIQMRPIDYDTLVKDMKSELQEASVKGHFIPQFEVQSIPHPLVG
jgi:hypothetical protein